MTRSLWCLVALLALFSSASAQDFSLRGALQNAAQPEQASLASPPSPAWLSQSPGEQGLKSKRRAALYSLLVPGWGQYYAGDRQASQGFLAAEAATWASFIVFEVQGYLRQNGYRDFAQTFAGVTGQDHSDDYYAIISEYDSWVDYETAIKTEGRFALYPGGDTAALERYFVENRVSDFEPWVWSDSDARRDYRSRRSASKGSYRRALYAVAFGMANRVASAFFAMKAVNEANEGRQGERIGYRVEVGAPVAHPGDGLQTGLTFVATF